MYGEAEFAEPAFGKGPLGLLDRVLAPLGIGRRYATRPTIFEKFLLHPLRRAHSLITGTGVALVKPWKYERDREVQSFLFGGAFPEAFSGPRGKIVPTGAGPWESAGFLERLKTIFGVSDKYVIARTQAAHEAELAGKGITAADLVVPIKRGAVTSIETPISRTPTPLSRRGVAGGKATLTAGGNISPFRYPEYYAGPAGPRARIAELSNYMAIRLNALAGESILGIGFKPSPKLSINLLRLAGIPVAYETLRQTVLAADYTLEQLTGVSPIKGGAWLYAQARLGQQWARDVLGITTTTRWMEDKFPGIIDSGASFFARTLLAPAVAIFTTMNKTGSLVKGAIASALIYGAIGGAGLTQSYTELKEEYAGIRQVPVRGGRFWFMGYQSFLGGNITHYAPSWYVRLQNDAWYRSVYGSKAAYFRQQNVFGFPFPTPWNLFGARNLLNPYEYEESTYYSRPVPYSAPLFQEFPIFGPLLSATLGQIIKPIKRMHGLEATATLRQTGLGNEVRMPSYVSQRLGIPPLPSVISEPLAPGDFAMRSRLFGEAALAPLGVYDFMLEQFGLRPKPPNDHLQTALDSTAVARELEAAGIGGFFGQCFIAGTMITTKEGDLPIEKIEAGDLVLSQDGEWREVITRLDMGEADDLYRVTIPSIDVELIATAKHHIPVFTPENPGSLQDTNVCDLRPGDVILVPLARPEQEPEPIPGWAYTVDEKIGRLLGMCVAGETEVQEDKVTFNFKNTNLAVLTRCVSAVEYLFGCEGLVATSDTGCSASFASQVLPAFIFDFFLTDEYIPYLSRAVDGAAGGFLQTVVSLGATGTEENPRVDVPHEQLAWLIFSLSARYRSMPRIRRTNGTTVLAWDGMAAALMNILCQEGRVAAPAIFDDLHIRSEIGHVEKLDRKERVYDLEIDEVHYYTANHVLVHNTEFIRRFLFTPRYRESALRQRINPIRNLMPTWLPGTSAESQRDKTYFIDLHTGVAQTKIPGGEYLLPGPGYEATHPIHSGTPGVYDDVDQFLVLSQAAPFSDSYQIAYRKVRQQWSKLTPEWKHIVLIAIEQREARRGMTQVGSWRSVTAVEGANREPGIVGALQEQWRGLTSVVQNIPLIGPKFGPELTPLEKYKRQILYGATIPDWSHPIRNILAPWAYTTVNAPPAVAALRGAVTGLALMSPLGQMFSPLKATSGTVVGLTLGSLLGSTVRSTATQQFIPPQVYQRREAYEYLDYLKYIRSRSLQERAQELGEASIANFYAQQAHRTFVGARDAQDYRAALPSTQRAFFDAFRYAPESQRPLILSVVPDHMRQVLEKAWSSSNKSFHRQAGFKAADEAALTYFQGKPLPPPDSLVWHPDVNFDTIRIKMLQGGLGGWASDLHQYGYYGPQIQEAEQRYPNIKINPPLFTAPSIPGSAQAFLWSMNGGYRHLDYQRLADYSASMAHVPGYSTITLRNTDRQAYVGYLQDVMR